MAEECTIEVDGDYSSAPVVSLTGAVDIAVAPVLRRTLIDLTQHAPQAVIVDCSGVTFLDSSGLGVLIGVMKRLKHHDGQLIVVADHAPVLRLFEMTGLDRAFTVVASRAEAARLLATAG